MEENEIRTRDKKMFSTRQINVLTIKESKRTSRRIHVPKEGLYVERIDGNTSSGKIYIPYMQS